MSDMFSKLKANRGSTLAKLTEKLEEMNKSSGNEKDERLYKPGFDKKEGKGYAVVRFLPAQEGDPFVRVFSHYFKGKKGWYVENSRSTLGKSEKDPVGVSNSLYWKKGEEEDFDGKQNTPFHALVRSRKRNTKYYANVYIIKDTVNPENEGQVKIMEFGGQLFKMVEKALKPEFEDDQPLDPFDMWGGANFKIKIVGKEIPDNRNPGQKTIVPNYENSEFDRASEFFDGDDEKKEEIFKLTHNLQDLVKVKPFEDLAAQFLRATGEAYNALEDGGDPADSVVDRIQRETKLEEEQDNEPKVGKSSEQEESKSRIEVDDDEDDDILKEFERLANES